MGDYIVINDGQYNTTWMIAGFATYYNKGDDRAAGHHVVLMPRDYLHNIRWDTSLETPAWSNTQQMNTTNTTGVSKNELNPLYNDEVDPSTGTVTRPGTHGEETAGAQAYYGSDMNQIYIPGIVTQMKSLLTNSHMLEIRFLLDHTMNLTKAHPLVDGWKGIPSNWAWFTEQAVLASELEMYGANVWSLGGYDVGINNNKLPAFNFITQNAFSRASYWLRSVALSSNFCGVDSSGRSGCWGASYFGYARPLIFVK